MTTIAVYQGACPSREIATFRGVCERVSREEATAIYRVSSVQGLLRLGRSLSPHSVEHLVIAGHGGPTWALGPDCLRNAVVPAFAQHWRHAFTLKPMISLASCLSSRSPSWYLREKFGYLGSDWGPRGYLPGGEASLAARIRDYLTYFGVLAEVRGHRSAGHTSYNPILAVHKPPVKSPCASWWALENPGKIPSRGERRKWVSEMQGQPAENWLMGWI